MFIFSKSSEENFEIFWKGLVNDIGIAGIISLIMYACTFFSPLHPFKESSGRKFIMISYTLLVFLITAYFMLDLYGIDFFNERMTLRRLELIFTSSKESTQFWAGFYWMPFFLAILVFTWSWWLFQGWVYYQLGFLSRPDNKVYRLFWQVLLVGLFGLAGYYSIDKAKKTTLDEIDLTVSQKVALTINPIQGLFIK
jgi:hypothetical protein